MSAAVHAARGRRYPVNAIEFARRLYDDGKTIAEVRAALARHGYYPSHKSVVHWCEPEVREAFNLRRNHKLWPRDQRRRRETEWQVKRERMERLREAGLTFSAIAKVINLDFGLELDAEQARGILRGRIGSQATRLLLSGEKLSRGRIVRSR